MKVSIALAIACVLLASCGSDKTPATGKPQEIIGRDDFSARIINTSLTSARDLSESEARTILTNNFDSIVRTDVGMKWKEISQRLIKDPNTDKYCYEKSETEYKILEVLPAGTATNIQGDALKVEVSGKTIAIEGDDCTNTLGEEVAFGPYSYEMENWASSETVDSMMQGFNQISDIKIGTVNGKEAMKGSIVVDGITYNFVDYVDQPTIAGTYITHYQENHLGKVFQIFSNSILQN